MTKYERAQLRIAFDKLGADEDDYDGAMIILFRLLGGKIELIEPGKRINVFELMSINKAGRRRQ